MAVVVLDLNGGGGESNNVICQARSNDTTGGPLSKVDATNPLPEFFSSETAQTLNFGRPSASNSTGTYTLRCTIPPRSNSGVSGILSYRYDEPT